MSNPILMHILKTDRPSSRLELIEIWCNLSIKNQNDIEKENSHEWNKGYLECLKDLYEIIKLK